MKNNKKYITMKNEVMKELELESAQVDERMEKYLNLLNNKTIINKINIGDCININKIIGIEENNFLIEIDYKNIGYIKINEFSNLILNILDYVNERYNLNYKNEEYIKFLKEHSIECIEYINNYIKKDGVEFKCYVKKYNKNKGIYELSYKEYFKRYMYKKIKADIESGKRDIYYYSRIKELIKGGYIVELYIEDIFGGLDVIEVFMPGSLISVNKINNFSDYVGLEIYVCPIGIENGIIIVSSREYLNNVVLDENCKYIREDKKNNKLKDKLLRGRITGGSNLGIFLEFNYINNNYYDDLFYVCTGLLLYENMNKETQEMYKNGVLKVGDFVEFYITDIINNKIINLSQLTQLKKEVDDKKNKSIKIIK